MSPYSNLGILSQMEFCDGSSRANAQLVGNSVVPSWANPAFGLQSAPAITGTFTNVPGATSPYTNTFSGGQRFFRLVQ